MKTTSEARVERKLAAILAADVAGYSRLMGADEEGTLERLKALRRELVDPNIAEHHGRIVKTTGDGLLVEFASVVDAVRCAVAVQQAMPERDTGVGADERIELRIGINLGDVIVEDDDLYGDGVNIAARIESLADAGGVFVSNTVHDQVRDRLPFVFEDLGEQQVKNIARPVRIYRVRDTGVTAKTATTPTPGVLPLPDKPSIAVLPFQNLSGDPEQEYFVDGMVEEICRKQAETGVDVINDGEFGKASLGAIDYGAWSSYAWARLSGWEPGEPGRLPALAGRRDRQKFAEFYAELDATGFRSSSSLGGRPPVFTGPIAYIGQQAVRADLANFKAALAKVTAEEGFITAVAPGSFGRRQNRYYASDEAFLYALAEALREEYQAIVEAGFVLQLDDPGLPDTWDMASPEPSVAEYRKFAELRVEALNHALRDLPEERIRYHICWGSWHGPHTTDLPLKHIVDVLLKVRAGAFSIEAGNVRHEHEWKVWRDVKLPEGKILIPGVVSHATNVVEHPEVVADRILNFAERRRSRERHRRHRLRPRRADSSAARLGQARSAGRRRQARDQPFVAVRRGPSAHPRSNARTVRAVPTKLNRTRPLPNPPPSRGRAYMSTPICTPAPSMGAGWGGGDACRVLRLGRNRSRSGSRARSRAASRS